MKFVRSRRLAAINLGLLAIVGARAFAAEGTTAPASESVRLELETDALSTLNDLRLTASQIDAVKGLAADTAEQPKSDTAEFTPDYVSALAQLKRALVSGNADAVEDAEETVSKAEVQSDKDLGVDLELSDAARTKAVTVIKLLTPHQVASYISSIADDVPDVSRLLIALVDETHDKDADFAADRDDALAQIRVLALGAATGKSSSQVQKVHKFLDQVKQTSDEDFATRRADFEKQAGEICKLDPVSAVRHWVEHDVAELLSNPQLPAALDEIHPALAAHGNKGDE